MNQNASSPWWVKTIAGVLCLAALTVMWQYLASLAMLALMFKGKPPIQVLPWTLWQYINQYPDNPVVMKPAKVGLVVSAAITFGFPVLVVINGLKRNEKLHGTARFATWGEIRKMGLLSPTGTLIGKLKGKFLRLAKGHIQLAAATGTGKGVGFVVPNLLTDDDSYIVSDPKLYNWSVTAGYRQKCGHKVFLFAPGDADRRTHRYNPLAYIREDLKYRIDDTQRVANVLIPDVQGTDPIWTAGSRSLFNGLVLFMKETPGRNVTMGQLARESFMLDAKVMRQIIADRHAAGDPLSDQCVMYLTDYINAPDKTRESIRKTFTARMELFLSPIIDAATSGNDFDLRLLRRERTTIYLGVEPNDIPRLGPLMNLFYQHVVQLNTDVLPRKDRSCKYQVTLMLDEAKAIGKMQYVVDSIAYLREYGVRLMPVYQTESQFVELYGADAAKSFFDNLHARIVFEPPRRESAETLAKELGQMTVAQHSKSSPSGFFGKGNTSETESQAGKALVSAEDLLAMGTRTAFIFVRGQRPIKCDKIFFYEDPRFMDRLKAVSPLLADVGKRLPTEAELDAAMEANQLAPVLEPVPIPEYKPMEAPADDREVRPVEVTDIPKLNSLRLSDFSFDFSDIKVPAGDMNEDEMAELADSVYRKLVDN